MKFRAKGLMRAAADILVYVVLPLAIWTYGVQVVSQYTALLLSAVPGIAYTLARFAQERQFHVTGIYLLGAMILSTFVDLWSGSATAMLQNNVYVKYGLSAVVVMTALLRRPLALSFAVDFSYVYGESREQARTKYTHPAVSPFFYLLTLLLAFNYAAGACAKQYLLDLYGIEQYHRVFLMLSCLEGLLGSLYMASWLFVRSKATAIAEHFGTELDDFQQA